MDIVSRFDTANIHIHNEFNLNNNMKSQLAFEKGETGSILPLASIIRAMLSRSSFELRLYTLVPLLDQRLH